MGQILQPAIELAEKGFPVSEVTSYHWKQDAHVLQAAGNPHGKDLLIDGQAPEHGQVFHNLFLADTFKVRRSVLSKYLWQLGVNEASAAKAQVSSLVTGRIHE